MIKSKSTCASTFVMLPETECQMEFQNALFIDAEQPGWEVKTYFDEPTEAEIKAMEDVIDIDASLEMLEEDSGTSLDDFRKELGV